MAYDPDRDSDLVECIDCGEPCKDNEPGEDGSLTCSPKCPACKIGPCLCNASEEAEGRPDVCGNCGGRRTEPDYDRTPTAPEGHPITMAQLVASDVPDTWESREAIRGVVRERLVDMRDRLKALDERMRGGR